MSDQRQPTPSLSSQLLALLYQHLGTPVSGEHLATKLRVTRVTVWKHIQALNTAGFTINSHPHHGYTLDAEPTQLHPDALARHLAQQQIPDSAVTLLPTIDSTNDEANRQLSAHRETPFAIIAQNQTKGRGRLGRPWASDTASNLYLTLALRPQLPPSQMSTFTLWIGATLCDHLANTLGISPELKWPNDILLKGRKLCGILTEARIDTDRIRDLVLGIGLNINTPPQLPDTRHTATSLSENLGRPIAIHPFTATLIKHLLATTRQYLDNPKQPSLPTLWQKYDTLFNKSVTLTTGTSTYSGIARGIDLTGNLLLQHPDGTLSPHNAGDTTLSKT